MNSKHLLATAMTILSLTASRAQAGASLFVDDAAATPAGRCQLESWLRVYAPGQELTAAPACNVAGTEFGIGVSQYANPEAGPIWSLGAKRLLRDFDQHDVGVGVSAGATWNGDIHRWDSWSVNVPVSVAVTADRSVIAHANAGWTKRDQQTGSLTAGVGLEVALAPAWVLLAEIFSDHRGPLIGQLGVRHTLAEGASLDLLIGQQDPELNGPWVTLGFNTLLGP